MTDAWAVAECGGWGSCLGVTGALAGAGDWALDSV